MHGGVLFPFGGGNVTSRAFTFLDVSAGKF
jgi:hypothetical protein